MRHSLRALLCIIVLSIVVAACGGQPATGNSTPAATAAPTPITLNIFAAASLTDSFKEIASQYQAKHPEIKITYNFNGSQLLVQQMSNGAPADIFASADLTNMQKASQGNLVANSQIFARNKLTVIVPANNPANITTLKDLSRKGIKLVIAAADVPVGKYTLQVLDNMASSPDYGASYPNSVKANVVSQEENVKAVVQKVQLGEADAGVVYSTDAFVAADKVKFIEIPDNFNVIAQYPIAVTKNSTHATEAQTFVQFVLSSDGQAILAKYRFLGASSS